MHRPPRILIVEDDVDILTVLKYQLEYRGFYVATALSGRDGLNQLTSFWPDVILSDVMMPVMDGFQFARQVKEKTDIPIIFLTVVDESTHKAAALQEFADDYIVKPCDPPELYARIERVLRYNGLQPHDEAHLAIDDYLTLDLGHALAHTPSGTIRLTTTEARLLYHLARNVGRPVSNDELARQIWSTSASQDLLRNTIARLRAKLEPDPGNPRYILSKRRAGYLLATRSSPPALTEQQVEILRLIARGHTDNEIAVLLGLSSKTISAHIKLIRKMLAADSRAHAVALAMHYGLLKTSDASPDNGSKPGDP